MKCPVRVEPVFPAETRNQRGNGDRGGGMGRADALKLIIMLSGGNKKLLNPDIMTHVLTRNVFGPLIATKTRRSPRF